MRNVLVVSSKTSGDVWFLDPAPAQEEVHEKSDYFSSLSDSMKQIQSGEFQGCFGWAAEWAQRGD